MDFPKGLVLTKENNNTENLLFWTRGSSFRTHRPGPYRAGPSVPRPILSLGMLPGCKGQPFLPRWQCPSSCLLHPRSRTQFSEAHIKSTVSLKSALSTLGPFNNGNILPFKCMILFFGTPNTSEHISSMLIYFQEYRTFNTRSLGEGFQRTVPPRSWPFCSGPFVLQQKGGNVPSYVFWV